MNYYEVLGVDQNASADDIHKQYRRLIQKYHPDHNPSDADAVERFIEIQKAYKVLSNAEKRKEYDSQLNYEIDNRLGDASEAFEATARFMYQAAVKAAKEATENQKDEFGCYLEAYLAGSWAATLVAEQIPDPDSVYKRALQEALKAVKRVEQSAGPDEIDKAIQQKFHKIVEREAEKAAKVAIANQEANQTPQQRAQNPTIFALLSTHVRSKWSLKSIWNFFLVGLISSIIAVFVARIAEDLLHSFLFFPVLIAGQIYVITKITQSEFFDKKEALTGALFGNIAMLIYLIHNFTENTPEI